MRRSSVAIIVLSCFSLLLVQTTDVHLHAYVGKHDDGAVHGLHLQQAYSSHHADDSAHADVSVNEPAPTSFSKSDVYAAAPSTSHFAFPTVWRAHKFHPEPTPPSPDNAYWRPHLRAPPSHI